MLKKCISHFLQKVFDLFCFVFFKKKKKKRKKLFSSLLNKKKEEKKEKKNESRIVVASYNCGNYIQHIYRGENNETGILVQEILQDCLCLFHGGIVLFCVEEKTAAFETNVVAFKTICALHAHR
jgi:hypothetical protein